jgi:hypothetical protein
MTSQVLGGAILAIGIAYIKVSPFLPEVTTHTQTHTHKVLGPVLSIQFPEFRPIQFPEFRQMPSLETGRALAPCCPLVKLPLF